jgi:hypothetical protein
MTVRPSKETLESLRITLQRLEQTVDPMADAQSLADLKRVILGRIADLEALNALSPTASEIQTAAAPDSETTITPEPVQKSNQNSPSNQNSRVED